MRIRQLLDLLFEAPIEDYQLIGDFNRSSSFRKPADRRLVSNPVYVQRVKNMFAKTDIDIRMFFVNNAEANRHTEVGIVDLPWMQRNMPTTLEAINQQGGFGQNALNMIYANNKGAEWRPMTGWIMAHRMAHVVIKPFSPAMNMIEREAGDQFKSIFNSYSVEIPAKTKVFQFQASGETSIFTRFFSQIGTMKSARDGSLRTPYEFVCECFAQYMVNGQVSFNPPPQQIVVKFYGGRPAYRNIYGPMDYHHVEDSLEYISTTLAQEFDRALNGGIGKIFVM